MHRVDFTNIPTSGNIGQKWGTRAPVWDQGLTVIIMTP